jgi:hypothetical protein
MRKWMEERGLQPGDGSSTHVSSKEGMLEALDAFKRSLAEAGVELEVDISSAAVIDKSVFLVTILYYQPNIEI